MQIATASYEDKLWASLAHASILLSLITFGLLGTVAAFVIWLVKRPVSPYASQQALQAAIYQLIVVVISWIAWAIVIVLIFAVIGLCLLPLMGILQLVPVAYGCYAAYACSQGRDFRYWLIGGLVAPAEPA